MTVAMGDQKVMQQAMDMLGEIKESIINAYELKTGQSRTKISHMMDNETWFNAKKAVELGFADDILYADGSGKPEEPEAVMFSKTIVLNSFLGKFKGNTESTVPKPEPVPEEKPAPVTDTRVDAARLLERLNLLTH